MKPAELTTGPQPGERVLDMCAAPGGKTTHIGQRLANTGLVVACDKSLNKVKSIETNCSRLGVNNVRCFAMDASKVLGVEESASAPSSPPFPREYFHRVLLDAPCSALGQRPQFYNRMKLKELESFPKIQRKLFTTGVSLVAVGGVLVYSTCTNNVRENEELVTWATETFPNLEEVERRRFGQPNSDIDTITFFIAKFVKKS